MAQQKIEGMLSPYRVLDLADEKGLICGKLLGDLGADVIKVERPGGDSTRNIGPFYHDEVTPEKSLFWYAFNTSKRGITIDIETAEGQSVFKNLVETADIVIESFPPGYMDTLGLGYSALEKVNPGVIMVSITPFGQTGPYKDYKAPDIVAWAMGGEMYVSGDADRPPVRVSHHSQAYLQAGAEGAVGAMLALSYRQMTGEGQHVDVSIQESVVSIAHSPSTIQWDTLKVIGRQKELRGAGVRLGRIWTCKDGQISWSYQGGAGGVSRNSPVPLLQWMDSEGMLNDFLKGFNWASFDVLTTTQEIVERIEEPIRKFFLTHTKAELCEGALERHIQLYPISTSADMLENVQLAAREYWVKLEHPELGTTLTYPGAFINVSEAPVRVWRRAPLIGEHNQEILEKELDSKKLPASKQAKDNLAKLTKKSKGEKSGAKPLEGVRVADVTWAAVGPVTTKILSDFGAEVIKIEGRTRNGRIAGGPHKDNIIGLNRCGTFNQYNTGKLSLALNLTRPKGVEAAKRVIAQADIVVENFSGGTMKRMGLGYEVLKKIKPDIIMLSSCMMGQTGPEATRPGMGAGLTTQAGFTNITGWPDGEPVSPGGAYTDYIAPLFNAVAILAALDYRRRTGKGQYLDGAQFENVIHYMAPIVLDYEVNGRVASRMGNRYQNAAPHGAYRCRGEDRWCAIAVFTDEEWQNFRWVIGNPPWTNESKFSTLAGRKVNEDELDRLVEEWTIKRSAEEVMYLMQATGVPAGVLETGEDLLEHDPQLRYRHFFWEIDHPEVGKYYPPRSAFILSKTPGEVRRAPLISEHNEYALKQLGSMSDEEFNELVKEGVIE